MHEEIKRLRTEEVSHRNSNDWQSGEHGGGRSRR
jgi:hypothetical protein